MSAEIRENVVARLRLEGALRRVATLAAQGADPDKLFATIAAEATPVLGLRTLSFVAFDSGKQTLTTVAVSRGFDAVEHPRARRPLTSCRLASDIVQTALPTRSESLCCEAHAEPAVAAPIQVDGEIWGMLVGHGEPSLCLPDGSEGQLADFAGLMAAAIATGRRSDVLRDLAESQGALRRVATLVADDADPQTVFAAVASEAARILNVGAVSLIRYDPQRQMFTKIYGTHGTRAAVPDGGASAIENWPEGELILATGRPVRIDDWSNIPGPVAARHREQGFGEAVAAPIILEGTLWGHMAAFGEAGDALPEGCELRLADFTQLMASAIGNARARDELRALAAQQGAALRRVATLVAQRALPSAIFSAVAAEASNALRVQRVEVGRRRADGSIVLVGSTAAPTEARVFSPHGHDVALQVLESGQSIRVDDWSSTSAASTTSALSSVVGAPIIVDRTTWGVIVALAETSLAHDTELRLTDFTHLIASSIANMQARNEIIASRARIVAASDEGRRRIERNLHDGIQQRVVSLGLSLRLVRTQYSLSPEVQSGLDKVARDLDTVIEEIQVFSQGLHPALLSRAGLGPSLRALTRRSPVPVTLEVASTRLPEPVETAVYYVVSEALANISKHAQATDVTIAVTCDDDQVKATVTDDGIGGATPGAGSGLTGLVDRVEALGGRFWVDSPPAFGTRITIVLPLSPPILADSPAP